MTIGNSTGIYNLTFKIDLGNLSYGYINASYNEYLSYLDIESNIKNIIGIYVSFQNIKDAVIWGGYNFTSLKLILPSAGKLTLTFSILSGYSLFNVTTTLYPNTKAGIQILYTNDNMTLVSSLKIGNIVSDENFSQITPRIPEIINFSSFSIPAEAFIGNSTYYIIGYGLNFTKALFYYFRTQENLTFINITYNLHLLDNYSFGGIIDNIPYVVTPKGLEGPIRPTFFEYISEGMILQVSLSDSLYYLGMNGSIYELKVGKPNVVYSTFLFYRFSPIIYEKIISQIPELVEINSSIIKYEGQRVMINGTNYLLIASDIPSYLYLMYSLTIKPGYLELSLITFSALLIINLFINRKYLLKR